MVRVGGACMNNIFSYPRTVSSFNEKSKLASQASRPRMDTTAKSPSCRFQRWRRQSLNARSGSCADACMCVDVFWVRLDTACTAQPCLFSTIIRATMASSVVGQSSPHESGWKYSADSREDHPGKYHYYAYQTCHGATWFGATWLGTGEWTTDDDGDKDVFWHTGSISAWKKVVLPPQADRHVRSSHCISLTAGSGNLIPKVYRTASA